jgi:hypothetical protein
MLSSPLFCLFTIYMDYFVSRRRYMIVGNVMLASFLERTLWGGGMSYNKASISVALARTCI